MKVVTSIRIPGVDDEKDAYELTAEDGGVSVRSLRVAFSPPTVKVAALREALERLEAGEGSS